MENIIGRCPLCWSPIDERGEHMLPHREYRCDLCGGLIEFYTGRPRCRRCGEWGPPLTLVYDESQDGSGLEA